jgi:hypothetical protein
VHESVDSVLEDDPVSDPSTVTPQRVRRIELRTRRQQCSELDPDRLDQR